MKLFLRLALAIALGLVSGAAAAALPQATLHASPSCNCCGKYAAYLREHGFDVVVKKTSSLDELAHIARRNQVPRKYREQPMGADTGICHVTVVDGYTVVGHVPARVVHRLLGQRPKNIVGIILPGMPAGSPGMGGTKDGPFVVYAFNASGKTWVYAKV